MGNTNEKKAEVVTLDETKRQQLVAKFIKTDDAIFERTRKNTWKLAKMAYSITQDKSFKKAFKNASDFASAVGYTPGAMSKLISCGDIDSKYNVSESYSLTTGQTQELIPLFRLELDNSVDTDGNSISRLQGFLDEYKDALFDMTTKEVRELVKNELCALAGPTTETDDEETKSTEEVNADDLTPASNNDAIPKSAQEVLDEIIGIVQQEIEQQEDIENRNFDYVYPAYMAIVTLLQGEELL